jgi:putative aldouronate transport system permease protein
MTADPTTSPGTDPAAADLGPTREPDGAAPSASRVVPRRKKNFFALVWQHRALCLMALPGIAYFLIFKYAPMGGIVIAFQDYSPYRGILASPWVGFQHFVRLFTEDTFFMLLRNTLTLSLLLMVVSFPIPIILSLLLNELRGKIFKRSVQTVIYIPHFMSWVIVVSIFYVMLTTDGGAINNIITSLGGKPIGFLTEPGWLRPMYIFQNLWHGAGWGTIVYLAALTAVDMSLYEAAEIDGANRWKQTWHITLPAIRSTIIVMLILNIGDFLELGFEHMFLLLNSMNREVGEIFDTFVFTVGIQNGQLSFATAVGLFKGLVGLILVVFANSLAKKFGEEGVY